MGNKDQRLHRDNPSSLVGMGASQPGKVVISLGTSDTFFAAMPEVVTDPDGCGHVFGNPLGGSMSLQCFSNGSLAREAVKDASIMIGNNSQSSIQTRPGNAGNLMLPFFHPEISPQIKLPAPLLQGSTAFEDWREGQQAIRACVEGQFINMQLCSNWMQLQPDVIYLTGALRKQCDRSNCCRYFPSKSATPQPDRIGCARCRHACRAQHIRHTAARSGNPIL